MNYQFATSGTTGRPKHFRLTNEHIEARIRRMTVCRPPGWDKVRSIYSDFPSGRPGMNVRWVRERGGQVYGPLATFDETVGQIYEFHPDVIMGWPSALVRIAHTINNLYHPMFVWSTSALMAPEQCISIRAGLGDNVWSSYNTTEVGTISLANAEQIETVYGCVGKPCEDTEVRIEDGEVCVRTPTMIDGYLDTPMLSIRFFRDGWFHTGDLGWITVDGLIVLNGRKG